MKGLKKAATIALRRGFIAAMTIAGAAIVALPTAPAGIGDVVQPLALAVWLTVIGFLGRFLQVLVEELTKAWDR